MTEEKSLQNEADERFMARCIRLARMGRRTAAPNPMVGAVVVCDGRIIGEGFHIRPGEGHAEVRAIAAVRPEDRPLLRRSTIYVSLEPCAHFGRTPPCADLIVREGIVRCVVGAVDPFARVAGRGIARLRSAGVDVRTSVLEKECLWLNRRFFTFHTLGRPHITLKWAESADGFIGNRARRLLLSTPRSLVHVHRLRAHAEAILVGRATFEADRPRLDVRHWAGANPRRLVLGKVAAEALPDGFCGYADVPSLLKGLHEAGVQSLLVEGGRQTLQTFIDEGLWDEVWREISPEAAGGDVPAPAMPAGLAPVLEQRFGAVLWHYVRPGAAGVGMSEKAV